MSWNVKVSTFYRENELSESQQVFVKDYFIRNVSPQLMTIILDEVTQFPMLKDTAAYLAVKMVIVNPEETKVSKELQYALIEIPKGIDRFVELPKENGKSYIIVLDDLIRYCLRHIFNMFNYESISAHMIKITRDAELDIDNDLKQKFYRKNIIEC